MPQWIAAPPTAAIRMPQGVATKFSLQFSRVFIDPGPHRDFHAITNLTTCNFPGIT